MKKLKIFIPIIAAAIIFSGCQKGDSLANAIPKDAMWVAHFDVKSMLKKADCNLFENDVVKSALLMAKASFPNEEVGKLIDEFQKNPNSLGITLTDEAYIFMNDLSVGFLFPVNDAKKLENNLLSLGMVDKDDLIRQKNVTVLYLGEYSIAWDKSKLLIFVNYPNEMDDSE
ncbi:MAG: DUF4836 family protein, partial [Prevotellaceae bacterium]|nr:DUF4836 family protein [Prevotellaceae bacterium]